MEADNKGNRFFIEVIPDVTKDGQFTGMFNLQICATPINISEDGFDRVEHICQLGCAALSLMQEDEEFKNIVYNFMMSPQISDNDNKIVKPTIKNITENVITLDFNKETKH
jgi:hypothetical protein